MMMMTMMILMMMMMMMMVVYNHENYIKEALNGILTQRCDFDSEIVIGEDFSSDSSRSIIVDFFNRFPGKFKLLFHEQNIGAQQNQQMVLDNCIGEFVAICEGDDYWTDPLKLQKQVDFLESHSDYSICFHPVEIFDQENNKLIEDNITRKVIDTTDIKELAKGNYIHTPSVMLRNDFVIPSWFAKCPIGDWTLYMIAVRDKKIKRLDDVMAVYRVHDQSMWSLKTNEHRILSTLKSIKLLIKSDEVGHEIKAILRRYALFLKNRLPERRNMFSEFMNKIKTFTKCLVL